MPPVMLRFTLDVLPELGFTNNQLLLSIEMWMKCGIGKCGP
jgi:sulfhydrogenase subunit gamma (sulfur reductase)